MGRPAKLVQQGRARGGSLQQHLVAQARADAFVHVAHLAVRSKQHEGPPLGSFEDFHNFFGGAASEAGIARVGQVNGRIEQRLLGVVEMRVQDPLFAILNAQAAFQEIEIGAHRESCRSEDDCFHFAEEDLLQDA